MSVSLLFLDDDDEVIGGDQVATNSGWAAFGKWVESLPDADSDEECEDDCLYDSVAELWELSFTDCPTDLASELRTAVRKHKPPEDVLEVAKAVIFLAKKYPSAAMVQVE
jgi:hypothetical protein